MEENPSQWSDFNGFVIPPLFLFFIFVFFGGLFGGGIDTSTRRRRRLRGSCAVCSEVLGAMGRFWSWATARAPPAWIGDARRLGGVCARRSMLYLTGYGRFNSPVSRAPRLRISSGRRRTRLPTDPTIGYMSSAAGTPPAGLYLENARFYTGVFAWGSKLRCNTRAPII